MSSVRSSRDHIGLVSLLVLIGWFYVSIQNAPAGVSSELLAVYLLPAAVFVAGFQLAAHCPARLTRQLDLIACVAAGATLFGATQLPRVGVVIDDWQDGSLLALCVTLALWAGILAQQMSDNLLAASSRAASRSAAQAGAMTAALASGVGLLGAMGMWIGWLPGSEGLVRHGLVCLAAAVAIVLSRLGGEWVQTAMVLALAFAVYAALREVQPDPGLWRPGALAGGLLLAGAFGRDRLVRATRLIVCGAAVVGGVYALVLAPGASVQELMEPRIWLAAVCGVLLAVAAANHADARSRARRGAGREAAEQRALVALLGFVMLATPWMAGLNLPLLAVGAVLLLAAGALTTRR
ncbi:hypothetical protein [Conexibacter woesei]|uniref:Uncharacterized protein n=1 Tax=Conexibacter woesei (strain DSM 14684 / CCUG 47730 / CIP 108061 / JCM 11494 / NBRC 100937 / ID131577) TaxID=469383 RepID=D3EZ04_CONWI|nr:hypothetical protein [Conexibacter woesei]ADB49878.1 hypothetical protein Cwoe_1450 [Conexibacter woesei DSM 14684]